jgi:hypothetical protein
MRSARPRAKLDATLQTAFLDFDASGGLSVPPAPRRLVATCERAARPLCVRNDAQAHCGKVGFVMAN